MSMRFSSGRAKLTVIRAASVGVVVAGIAWGAHAAWASWRNGGTSSCAWLVRVQGTATEPQIGLVRCYLKALAERDTATLETMAADAPGVRVTAADLAYSADARAGMATANLTPSPEDTAYVLLKIVYADGKREVTGITNMTAMGEPSVWRMDIGTARTKSQLPPPISP